MLLNCVNRNMLKPFLLADDFKQCQMVVSIADDLGFLGPGVPDLVTELCPPQDTA